MAAVASMVDVDLADGATTEAVAVVSVVVAVASVAAVVVSVVVAVHSVVVAVASVAAVVVSVVVAVASVAVDMRLVEADTGEAEAVMAVGAGRFCHELETLAAEDIALGRCVLEAA